MVTSPVAPRVRHEAILKIASGGMASVYLGALRGPHGFRQLVAIKQPHAHLLEEPGFRGTLVAEARLASRIHHANVVDVRDVEAVGGSIHLVMDYVEGASLGDLVAKWAKGGVRLAPGIAVRIVLDACAGLHAAHELTDDAGNALGLVHRDVSPQNILVGIDGVSRVTDFGIAKCMRQRDAPTTQGALKGKVGYMAPEYVRGGEVDRRVDVFALGVVLWEALVGRRLFRGDNDLETLDRVQHLVVPPPSSASEDLGAALDACILRALARDPDARFASADDLRAALEIAARAAGLIANHVDVGLHVRATFGDDLDTRRRLVCARENAAAEAVVTAVDVPRPSAPRVRSRTRGLVAALSLALIAGSVMMAIAVASTVPLARATPSLAAILEGWSALALAPPPALAPAPAPAPAPALAPAPSPSARARSGPRPHMPPPNPYRPATR
jgi:hypothetical protein